MPRAEAVTEDALLDGRVTLRQPAVGYRAAIDPVLLAAAVPASGRDQVLDVGAGVGAAALCLATRLPEVRVVGIEKQRDLVRLGAQNAAASGLAERIDMLVGDIARPPPRLEPRSFDHVMANPPFFESGRGRLPPDLAKAAAHIEGEAGVAAWVKYALAMVRDGGTVTLIHRADRLADLLALLTARAGEVVIFPLWSHEPFRVEPGRPAKRVILRARTGSKAPLRLAAGIVLHEADGRYTEAAEAVLRGGAALGL